MPTLHADKSTSADLSRALGESGEKEYRRMARVARMARGRFHLFPVQSDFTPKLRAGLFDRLRADLAANGQRLRVLTLTRKCWNAIALLEDQAPVQPDEVVVLVGLENTPGLVAEAGAKPQRPPALAAMNQMRETLHRQIPAPFFLWCPSYAYTALIEDAPDLFDQYTAQLRFQNVESTRLTLPETSGIDTLTRSTNLTNAEPTFGSQMAVDFCRGQVDANPQPDSQRAHALLDLVQALIDLPESEQQQHVPEAKQYTEEALRLLAKRRNFYNRYQWARGQDYLGYIYVVLLDGDVNANMRRAINYWKAALHVYNETEYPDDWARIHYDLGLVYTDLGSRYKDIYQERAIACFKAALRIYTEAHHPKDWADAQYRLGLTYTDLIAMANPISPRLAIVCFRAALRIYTVTDYPVDWAWTQYGLAQALAFDDAVRQSRAAMQKALRGFQTAGMEEDAQRAEEALRYLSTR